MGEESHGGELWKQRSGFVRFSKPGARPGAVLPGGRLLKCHKVAHSEKQNPEETGRDMKKPEEK